jgi:hypothetical protein
MRFTKITLPAVVLLALASVAPAVADGQRRHPGGGDSGRSSGGGGGRSHDGGGSRGVAVPRGNPGPRQSYARPSEVRPSAPYRGGGYAVPRGLPGRSYATARPYYNRPDYRRSYSRPYYNRPYYNRPSYSRPYYSRPYYSRPYYSRPYYGRPYYSGYGGYYRPYAFRPRFSVSLGFFSGYPVPYSWDYPAYAPAYGYAPPGGVVVPGPSTYGGVSFEVTPQDAEVYVDGEYAGTTTMFDGTQQPMSLAAGQHTIELRAPGCLPLVFAVNVLPGRVIPYQGSLSPLP